MGHSVGPQLILSGIQSAFEDQDPIYNITLDQRFGPANVSRLAIDLCLAGGAVRVNRGGS